MSDKFIVGSVTLGPKSAGRDPLDGFRTPAELAQRERQNQREELQRVIAKEEAKKRSLTAAIRRDERQRQLANMAATIAAAIVDDRCTRGGDRSDEGIAASAVSLARAILAEVEGS